MMSSILLRGEDRLTIKDEGGVIGKEGLKFDSLIIDGVRLDFCFLFVVFSIIDDVEC